MFTTVIGVPGVRKHLWGMNGTKIAELTGNFVTETDILGGSLAPVLKRYGICAHGSLVTNDNTKQRAPL